MATRPRTWRIGPASDGERMPLARFARAAAEPGFDYELDRGVIVVVDVPGVPHSRIVRRVRRSLEDYADDHPGTINHIAGATDSVVRVPERQSERHPDVTVYLTPPPGDDPNAWDAWTPDIVIEVVSRESRKRDYGAKVDDYLAAGARQYWIIDPLVRGAVLHRRRGDTWDTSRLTARATIRASILPGYGLRLADVFAVL